jgi:putative addiction module component (TIGR02574 family)
MSISNDIVSQVFSLPPDERYVLAQKLLDSVNDEEAVQFDAQFVAELKRRREELLGGIEGVDDWRVALSDIENSLSSGSPT